MPAMLTAGMSKKAVDHLGEMTSHISNIEAGAAFTAALRDFLLA
jgi:hypothetical protein